MAAPFHSHLTQDTRDNTAFRRVLSTGAKTQLVVMTIPPGGEVGTEMHDNVEQTFMVESGAGRATLNGTTLDLVAGDVLVVPPGTTHNIEVVGDAPLHLATIYAPPNHIDGRVHATKVDADADTEDEEFGHGVH